MHSLHANVSAGTIVITRTLQNQCFAKLRLNYEEMGRITKSGDKLIIMKRFVIFVR